jgi:uncharacterized protein (DUF2252 family)
MGGLGPLNRTVVKAAATIAEDGLKLVSTGGKTVGKGIALGLGEIDQVVAKTGSGKALQAFNLVDEAGSMTPKQVLSSLKGDLSRRELVNPEGLSRKVAALKSQPFAFFRGTAPQFYRRLFAEMPEGLKNAPKTVLQGDVHIENFGAIPGKRGLKYGLTDFDEAIKGPASVDLVRGMSSVVVAAGEKPGLLKAFLRGYRKGLDGKINLKSDVIGEFLAKQGKISQAEMLAERTAHDHSRLVLTDNHAALPKAMAKTIEKALGKVDLKPIAKKEVQDVVQVYSGTGSLDLRRYEAVLGSGKKSDVIVELKEMLPSSLTPHVGTTASNLARYEKALATYQGKAAQSVTTVTLDSQPYLVRLRAPYKGGVKFADVKGSQQETFLEDLGKILGKAHGKGGDGKALEYFVTGHEDDLIDTAIKQARHSLSDFQLFAAH